MIQVAGIYENGHITLLAPIPKKKAKVIVTVVEEPEIVPGQNPRSDGEKRIAGLHKGEYFMSDDFDDPLPMNLHIFMP
jgi:hypothetical protein